MSDFESIRKAVESEPMNYVSDEELLAPLIRERTISSLSGGALIAGGVGAAVLIGSGVVDGNIGGSLPYSELAQDIVTSFDDYLAVAGAGLTFLGYTSVGGLKLAASKRSYANSIDTLSGKPLSVETSGKIGRLASKISGVVVTGVAMSTLAAGIGTAVTEGPNGPIESVFEIVGAEEGGSMIVGYDDAQPMLDSNVSRLDAASIIEQAGLENIDAVPMGLELTSITFGDDDYTSLTLGIEPSIDERLQPREDGLMPVIVDEIAGIPAGSEIIINGQEAVVTGTIEGASALNRVTVLASNGDLAEKLEGDKNHSFHAVLVDASEEKTTDIVKAAGATSSAVISTDKYIENSESFWNKNVKPITSVLHVMSALVALVSAGSLIGSGILKNRRELSTAYASGVSLSTLKSIEVIRSLKRGLVSAPVGVASAIAISPFVNSISLGLNYAIGMKEAMVGMAVGIGSSVAGAMMKVMKLESTINPEDHTRI
jgi:hypothetical protein